MVGQSNILDKSAIDLTHNDNGFAPLKWEQAVRSKYTYCWGGGEGKQYEVNTLPTAPPLDGGTITRAIGNYKGTCLFMTLGHIDFDKGKSFIALG